MWFNPEKEQEEPNFMHPDYIEAQTEAERKRSDAALDAALLFGVKLVDGVPEDDSWIANLKYMEKRGSIDLSDWDLDDEFEREFIYKRYVAMAGDDFTLIAELSGVPSGERARARNTFHGDEERDSTGSVPPEGERPD